MDDVRIEHVENMKELNIGYTGYYETLTDVIRCKNLETLIIGSPIGVPAHYLGGLNETPLPESAERIAQIQEELGMILCDCPRIRELRIYNSSGTCDLESLDFLKQGRNLEWLSLQNMGDINYSMILECSNLKTLDLWGCYISNVNNIGKLKSLTLLVLNDTRIADAGDIIKLEQLDVLMIENTPLAENEEELALIYETFPDIKLYK